MLKEWDDSSLTPAAIDVSPSERYVLTTRLWQGVPSIAWAGGKTLYATWISGGKNENGPGTYVLLARSDDNGLTWRDPIAVVAPLSYVRAESPILWRSPAGHMWWFWAQGWSCEDGHCWDGRLGVCCSVCKDPLAACPVWTKSRRISDGLMITKPSIKKNGQWLLPVSIPAMQPHHSDVEGRRLAGLVISEDHGETFSWVGGANLPDRTWDEHHIIERKDNSLLLLARSASGMTQSISVDGGITWIKGEKNGLPCPDSRFCVRRLASGRLLMMNHPTSTITAHTKGRDHLTAMLSDDDGGTWHSHTLIDWRDFPSYPDADQADDGTIYAIYDLHRYRYLNILLARFTEDELLSQRGISNKILTISAKESPMQKHPIT